MLGVAVIAAFFLPKHYTAETTIMIKAAPPVVYERAMDLPAWHALAQAAQLSLEKIDGDQLMQLLLQLPSGNGVVGAGVRLDTVRQYIAQGGSALVDKGVNQLKMVCRITETNPPHAFSLRVEGGPFHGLAQSVTLFPNYETYGASPVHDRSQVVQRGRPSIPKPPSKHPLCPYPYAERDGQVMEGYPRRALVGNWRNV